MTGPGAIHANAPGVSTRFLCRVGTVPADLVAQLLAPRAVRLAETLAGLERSLEARKQEVSALLHAVVGSAGDRRRRALFLKCRRDLFNLRSVEQEAVGLACANLEPVAAQTIREFACGVRSRLDLLAALDGAYRQEDSELRSRFHRLLEGQPDFQRALVLASPSLFRAWQRRDTAARNGHRAKRERVELALGRYFARAAMKATPFSRFCAVIPGRLVGNPRAAGSLARPPLSFTGNPRDLRCAMRPSKVLFRHVRSLVERDDATLRAMPLRLNPTLKVTARHLTFMTTAGGKEVVQRVERNRALDAIIDMLNSGQCYSLDQLVQRLGAEQSVSSTPAEAREYLDQLMRVGLLRQHMGIVDGEPKWDELLEALLGSLGTPIAAQCAGHLRQIRTSVASYLDADAQERARLDDYLRSVVQGGLTGPAGTVVPRSVVFEDATAPAELQVDAAHFDAVLKDLGWFAAAMSRISWARAEQAKLRAAFDSLYHHGAMVVPLLTFYEDYYRRDMEGGTGGMSNGGPTGADDPPPHYIRAAVGDLKGLVRRRWWESPQAEEIVIGRDDLDAAVAGLAPRAGEPWSLAVFGQLVPASASAGPRLRIRNGALLAGFGKYYSRFLYLLPSELQAHTLWENAGLSDAYVAEICGDADSNANLHPRLCPWDLGYPTGEFRRMEHTLDVGDLLVERDREDEHGLSLVHRLSGKRVVPVDLGFFASRYRPPLYQLLVRFSPVVNATYPLPDQHDAPGAGSGQGPASPVTCRPRICYARSLVLAPRCWFTSSEAIPRREHGEPQGHYFYRFSRWREAHGIPDQAYVRVQSGSQGAGTASIEKLLFRSRPQYVAFHSPLLLSAFLRVVEQPEPAVVSFEECLPGPEQLPQYAGDRYTTEVVLQVSRAARSSRASG